MTRAPTRLRDVGALPVAAACAAAVLLRLPTFRYPLVSDDEAIYDAMAQVVVHGGVMYRDTVDHKPPGLTYTYAAVRDAVTHLGGSFGAVLAVVHVVGVLTVVLTCLALHAVAREVLTPRLATIPPLLYAFASAASVPPDSLAVNGELLMNLPTTLAVLCALRASDTRRPTGRRVLADLSAGALVGIAALYKYQGAFVGLSFFFLLPSPRRDLGGFSRRLVARAPLLAIGLVLPFAATGLYFWHRGAWDDAIRWGVLFNLHYLAEGPDLATASSRFGMQLLGVVLPCGLVYAAAGVTLRFFSRAEGERLHAVTRGRALLLVWLVESLYCVTLGRRFFGHYFLQPLLPLCLLAAGPVASLWGRRPRIVAALLLVPALVFFGIAALPELSRKLVYASDPDFDAIGHEVAARTSPRDTIWVWGNVPQIYFTAERAPGVRFTFCNYLTGLSPGSRSELDPRYDSRQNAVPGAWDLVVHDLDAEKPALVVDTAAGGMKSYGKFPIASFPVLAAYLAQNYERVGVIEGAVLYRRIAPRPLSLRPGMLRPPS